jgi:hypothetical protein
MLTGHIARMVAMENSYSILVVKYEWKKSTSKIWT